MAVILTPVANAGAPRRRLDVVQLMAGESEIILVLNGQDYRLRITSAGKLILTK